MSISYPITLPTGNRVAVVFRPTSVVGISMSPFTFQQQVQAHQGQAWLAQISLAPMRRAAASEWIAALLSLNGRYGTFYLGDPAGTTPRGIATGTPKVKGASQTGQSLVTDGWTINQTGILKRGDWIQIGTGSTQRIYSVLTDANSSAAGEATLDIWPRLRESPVDNADITTSATAGVFRLTSNVTEWSVDAALLYGIEFEAMEAL